MDGLQVGGLDPSQGVEQSGWVDLDRGPGLWQHREQRSAAESSALIAVLIDTAGVPHQTIFHSARQPRQSPERVLGRVVPDSGAVGSEVSKCPGAQYRAARSQEA